MHSDCFPPTVCSAFRNPEALHFSCDTGFPPLRVIQPGKRFACRVTLTLPHKAAELNAQAFVAVFDEDVFKTG